MWKEQRLHELVDPFLAGGYKVAEIRKCSHVAMLCAQEDPADWPTMTDVAAMLNSKSISLPMEPKQPAVLIHGCADYIRSVARLYSVYSNEARGKYILL